MSIFDIFSKRQKRLRGDVPDVYAYDSIPQPLKVQIIHIWRDTLGDENQYRQEYLGTRQAYQFIVDTLCREYGLFRLPHVKDEYGGRHYIEELGNYLLNESNPEKVLDAVELSFRYIDKLTRRFDYLSRQNASSVADEAIEELNLRFREHGIGYEYVDGEVVRIDSELIHAEVVKPALALLRGVEYEGAQAEFLKAHEHYRKGNDKEALAECLKSFESVMKVICARRGWAHDPTATSRALLQIVFDNELIPKFWEQHFSALRSSLESGVPTARNRLGGHGQGVAVIQVPTYLVAYVLHLTASAIVFLREADNAKP
jgi:AbiJ N-terminal domain 4